jgi:alpha-ketoglutarate-dependent taurine dioxygenase
MRIETPEPGGATLIHAEPGESLMELPDTEIHALFNQAGALLFRGYAAGPDLMHAFAGRFSTRFNRDRLRPPVAGSDGYVQEVTEGMGYVEPHSEQANSPFRPDAIWFCCETPAAEGGETLLWDGVELWQRLAPDLRELFRAKRLRFFQRYPADRWQLFLGDDAVLADAERALSGRDDVSYFVADDQSIYMEYVCPAVVATRRDGAEAFANSLLSERSNTLGELMTFDDGSAITDDLVAAIEAAMAPLTVPIAWQPGDLAFIDNTRFLHGRNPYTDVRRRIYSSLSFLNF